MSADLRELSQTRLREARILLQNSEYSGAYYLAGYAVECGLKACIARQFRRYEMPDKKLVVDSHIHDIVRLVEIADLQGALTRKIKDDPAFEVNWRIVRDWNEASRYQLWSRQAAEGTVSAVDDREHGVARWIEKYW